MTKRQRDGWEGGDRRRNCRCSHSYREHETPGLACRSRYEFLRRYCECQVFVACLDGERYETMVTL